MRISTSKNSTYLKKALSLMGIFICLTGITNAQELTKKEGRKILEKAWTCVKTNDTGSFTKLWIFDKTPWPFHPWITLYTPADEKPNFYDFKTFFDSALVNNMKFDEVDCDTIEHGDPHRDFARYYIQAWFRYNNHFRKGFGFYMDYKDEKWGIRFSPDYLYDNKKAK